MWVCICPCVYIKTCIYFKDFESLHHISVENTQLIYHCLAGSFWIFPSVVSLSDGEIGFFSHKFCCSFLHAWIQCLICSGDLSHLCCWSLCTISTQVQKHCCNHTLPPVHCLYLSAPAEIVTALSPAQWIFSESLPPPSPSLLRSYTQELGFFLTRI